MRRWRLAELGRQRVKIIPQRDDLARGAGRQQLYAAQGQSESGGLMSAELIARIFGDGLAFEHAEADAACGGSEPDPACHQLKVS